ADNGEHLLHCKRERKADVADDLRAVGDAVGDLIGRMYERESAGRMPVIASRLERIETSPDFVLRRYYSIQRIVRERGPAATTGLSWDADSQLQRSLLCHGNPIERAGIRHD